ncbi:hypothetical protein CHLNCDRAFT_58899 [Chlorella variabilis]|uniref:Hydroxyproline O-arabinosyltransferase-like domain-containing protein n=1 Tax=Chlorella variabilis TaxID=554065 RepID=E1ZPN9_CHLVA|nr:hypothetical protein CHLNCDRAFT_58899 [Chlorella variabilis]EFN52293.1 hypothetical protein CHLNCDRAFT_58899 [Chlorella variabilis]|eukprot:XP_005844395.1 hypothetical protein CHLNCDRAFT_58899 [Chlorella variabilis]
MDWLGRNDVREEYVLVIDVDMILRAPLLPEALGARPGFAVAAFFDYLHGTHNELAERHLADVAPRQDELAGPAGRRADMVGGAYLAHREDMRRIAPLWLKYTENVRDDPRAWELAGEPGRAPGERPWICEMYGYSFAAARLGVWHRADQSLMLYPGYYPADPLPRVLHYGLLWNVSAGYEFNKHWHFQFDMLACPPWKLGESGLFKHPAHPRSLRSKGAELLKDLLAMEAIIYLNAAFCERHRARCPHSKALNWECSKAETLLKAYDAAWKAAVLAITDRDLKTAEALNWCKVNRLTYDCCVKTRGTRANCRGDCPSISDNGQVSIMVVRGTQVVQEAFPPLCVLRREAPSSSSHARRLQACTRHQTSPTASAALGRALLGTLLMGAFREQGEKTQVTFKGDGPLAGLQVIADASGTVKGKVGNPAADPPLRPDGKLNVGQAVGRGEIAEDLARYLVDSEQVQSALGLGVSIAKDLSIRAAGGFLIQVLPFAEDETIAQLEENIAAAGSVTDMLNAGMGAGDITERLLRGLGGNDTGFQLQPRYGPCEPSDLQDRMRSAVALLGESEVRAIVAEQGKIEVMCEFCRETYAFEEEEVLRALQT